MCHSVIIRGSGASSRSFALASAVAERVGVIASAVAGSAIMGVWGTPPGGNLTWCHGGECEGGKKGEGGREESRKEDGHEERTDEGGECEGGREETGRGREKEREEGGEKGGGNRESP